MTTSRKLPSLLAVTAGLTGAALAPSAALANPADMFGLGGRSMAMGGAYTSLADDPMATYYNVAGMSKQHQASVMVGLQMGAYRFGDRSNCPESSNVGCSEPFYFEHGGSYDIEQVRYGYENPHNLQLGLALPLHRRVTFGVGLSMPVDVKYDADGNFAGIGMRLARMQTLDAYLPSYALYRNRANRFAIYAGLGVEVVDGLHLGIGTSVAAGAYLGLAMGGDIFVTATPDSEDTAAVVDVALNTAMEVGMTTASAPVVGLLWEMGNVSDALDGFALGLSYRGQSAIDVDTLIDTDITVWADLSEESDPIAAPVQASGIALVLSEFVTPRQASAGFSGQIGERFTGSVDVTWVQWSQYKIPVADLIMPESDPVLGVAIETSPAREAAVVFYDTWVPKLGVEYVLGPYLTSSKLRGLKVALRAGGSYEPNPIPLQTGPTNLLMSDRITGTLGVGLAAGNPWMKTKDRPMSLDMFLQTHYLVPTTHLKDPANYNVSDPTKVDGYPVSGSYISKGVAVVGGLTASFAF